MNSKRHLYASPHPDNATVGVIELRITPTGKGYSPRDNWRHLSERDEVLHFGTKREAHQYLRERYGRAKRAVMYRDVPNSPPIRVGYVIGFRASDGGAHWLQQDWVEFRECRLISPEVRS